MCTQNATIALTVKHHVDLVADRLKLPGPPPPASLRRADFAPRGTSRVVPAPSSAQVIAAVSTVADITVVFRLHTQLLQDVGCIREEVGRASFPLQALDKLRLAKHHEAVPPHILRGVPTSAIE